MYKKLISILVLFLSSSIYAASFDCNKASTLTDKAICENQKISILDEIMVQDYKVQLKIDKETTTQNQRDWIRQQRNPCKGDVSCLEKEYLEKLSSLDINDLKIYLKNLGWNYKKYYGNGERFCGHDFEKNSKMIYVNVFCAGDGFVDIIIK